MPTDQQSFLGNDTCTDGAALCAPDNLADPSVTPAECRTFGNRDLEGRCLPACLPDIQAQADMLQQEDCADGELCAPCYDPVTGDSTGSCAINGDAPQDDPYTVPVCDAWGTLLGVPILDLGEGRCVPEYVVGDQASSLASDEPCIEGEVCAPCTDPDTGDPTGACPEP